PPRISGQARRRMKRLSMSGTGFDTGIEGADATFEPEVGDFIELMKPRVMSLVVFTALVGMVAAPGELHPVLAGIALLSIAVGAGASGALNMWYDADIDARMARTAGRPLPPRPVTAEAGRGLGTVLAIGSVLTLG